MKPERVRFSSHPRPFRVVATQCVNPACPCSEVTFDLVEVVEAGTSPAARLRLEIRVDPETWQEVHAPERPAALSGWVQEFLRDYPTAERPIFQQGAEKKRRVLQRLHDYRFDAEALAGRLVSFNEIVSEPGSANHEYFFGQLQHDGRTYLIRDLYCANPRCACSAVHLEFLLYTPPGTPDGQATAASHFLAVVSLRGDLRIEQVVVGTTAQATAVATAWWQDHRRVLADLRWRYDMIKDMARRSMPIGNVPATGTPRPYAPRPSAGHPGRNDPCPCGSGKKYKKCCGR